jgi:preprotein translocase subunit SecB
MSYKIISKFIKDVSFEIPNVKSFVMLEKEIANYSLNFDIKSKPYKTNIIEVDTILKIAPNEKVKNKILTEITGTALVSIEENFDNKKELEKIILIKIPQEMYITLYETFSYLFEKAGIKNLQIDKKVDFEKLYKETKR